MKYTFTLALIIVSASLFAQKKTPLANTIAQPAPIPASTFNAMSWRSIGPWRGGRSIAVAGHVRQPYTYYFGATGGGIWKTENGGNSWLSIADSFLTTSSVGALAVAQSDPNVLYAGMGERDIRGNISPGDGMYRSTDAGKTWQRCAPKTWRFIGRIVIHPEDPDRVFVAVLGDVFGDNKERGVYRTTDGGRNWEQVLYKNEKTGAVHVTLDPANPRVLFASLWECYRSPHSMSSGGEGSGLYKSTDGGTTWKEISKNPGLPKGTLGKIGISVSPVNSQRVYAMVEASAGGLFRSDDGGDTWARVNEDRNLRQRAWYYTHVHADPVELNTVYVLNVQLQKSVDGGKTFSTIPVKHGDTHDLWIDPANNQRMILGDDGGAEVTYNGGKSWSEENYPTAQFYHVHVDNAFPYRIYGAQQDNSTICIPSRTTDAGIGAKSWYPVAGGESGYIAINPRNPEITYGGSYHGFLTKYNKTTDESNDLRVWPDDGMGSGAGANKYRWQWTFPIVISPHDPDVMYATAQHVFRTQNEGMSWERISPDLTRNDSTRMQASGGPLTKDNTSVEYYCTIFTFAESPVQKGVLWAGSDDGLVHVSRDDGKTWSNVTPKGLPEWSLVSILEASPYDAGTAYLAANRYKLNDQKPYLFKTTDYGATWTQITSGIPEGAFARVIRADPHRKGLLYAGTETGMYVSFTDGATWQSLQLNLPVTPIHDLAIQAREKDLVAATHGRAFWVLDDLAPLHQLADKQATEIITKDAYLYAPEPVYRMGGGEGSSNAGGKNPPNGVVLYYYLKAAPTDTLRISFYDATGALIASYNNRQDPKGEAIDESKDFYEKKNATRQGVPSANAGQNRFVWNLNYPGATEVPKAIIWGGGLDGPRALPGTYTVKLSMGKWEQTQTFEVKHDPHIPATDADLKAQFDLAISIRDKVSDAHRAVNQIRGMRKAVNDLMAQIKGKPAHKVLEPDTKALLEKVTKCEEALLQTKSVSSQDPLNYPVRLNDKLVSLMDGVKDGYRRPTTQHVAVFNELAAKVDAELARLRPLLSEGVAALNAKIKEQSLPAVEVGDGKK